MINKQLIGLSKDKKKGFESLFLYQKPILLYKPKKQLTENSLYLGLMKKLLFIYMACLYLKCTGQNPLYKRFFDKNSSITGSIYDVFQDKKGFIWLGTENGLIRFDGKSTVLFYARKNFSKPVTNILEDKDGTIYCQNFSGQFFKTSPTNDSIIYIPQISSFGNIKQASIISDSLIAYVDKYGIGFYNPTINALIKKNIQYNEIQPSASKQTNDNYTVIFPEKHQLVQYFLKKQPVTKSFVSTNVVFLHLKFKGNNYILGKKPPFIVENVEAKKTVELKEINHKTIVNHITSIDNKTIVVLTSDGVYIYDENLKFKRHIFAKESISSFFKDQQENYWFGTLNNGLLLVSEPETCLLLMDKKFTSIAFKNSNLLAGTSENEIYEIDPKTFQTKLFYKDSTIHEVRKIYYHPLQDELLFSNQQLNIIKNSKLEIRVTSVNDIQPIKKNTYLLSEGSSVSFYPVLPDDDLFDWYNPKTRVYNDKRLALTHDNIRVKSSVYMNPEAIISATSNGLVLFSKKNRQELFYKNEKIKAISLAKINDDSLLIATSQDGILLYHNQHIEEYLNPKQFSYNDIYMMKVFEKKLFVVTYKSLDVFDGHKNKLLDQYISDGYYGCDLLDFVFKNNHTYAANINGVLVSPLYNFKKNNSAPKIYITKASINGTDTNFSEINELEYNSYYFDFLFSIIDFRGLETTKAFYKVNDGNWILTTENRIILTALEPNTYKIQLKAVNERGIETIQRATISFIIKPPFYKTWWFILLVCGSLIAILFALFKFRVNTIKKQNRILTEKVELENALQKSTLIGIKAQMNPHFIFNALNTIQSYIYLNDKKAAGDYLVSFSELTRHILEMSNRDKIPLNDEIRALNLYLKLEKMRFEDDFMYEISKTDDISDTIMIPSMLIQPYVENAVKHGLLHKKGLKTVQVLFTQNFNYLTVEIIDNGIGIDASTKINTIRNKKHNSFASEANKKRIDILNSNYSENIGVETITLKNENHLSIGTKIIIKIPIFL